MHIVLAWMLASLFVGFLGRKRRFGFWGYSLFAFFVTPVAAALALIFAAPSRPSPRAQAKPTPRQPVTAGGAAVGVPRSALVRGFVRLVLGWVLVIGAAAGVMMFVGGVAAADAVVYALSAGAILLLFAWTWARFPSGFHATSINSLGGSLRQNAERISALETLLNDQQQAIDRLRASTNQPSVQFPAVDARVRASSSAPN